MKIEVDDNVLHAILTSVLVIAFAAIVVAGILTMPEMFRAVSPGAASTSAPAPSSAAKEAAR